MKLHTFFLSAVLVSFSSINAFGNPIDYNCGHLTYRTAPVVKADQYICHTQYAVAYSYQSKNPIYTTELLIAGHIGNIDRTDNFRVDPAIPKQYQSSPKDYVNSGTACNGSKCDRGHMTPAQDFSACEICMSESFFMTNMVPQNYKNNEIIWAGLESKIRKYVMTHTAGVYVITGPVYQKKTPQKLLGKNNVWIPDQLFKVVIDATTGKSIAFMMPNAPETDLSLFVTNLITIEKATGIKFDRKLDKKTIANFNDW